MTTLADAQREFRDALLREGLLISMGVDGLYGRGGVFEHIVERINAVVGEVGDPDKPDVMRFPPGIGRWQLEKSGYLKSFPQLAGTVHSFMGTDKDHRALIETLQNAGDWAGGQQMTGVALTPAACYGVYPAVAARGQLPANGALVDVYTYCFRHEPSIDPARMQMFRQREHVRLGTEEQAITFRKLWMERGGYPLRGSDDARTGDDEFFAGQQDDAMVFDGRHRGQPVPRAHVGVVDVPLRIAQLDDDLRRPRKHHLGRHRD